MTPNVVFVLGGPGAGKGTQCARITQDFGFVHLSAGDLLRAERDSGNETGTLISTYINEGKIVPVEVTVGLIKNAMLSHLADGRTRFLVDGFPRNQDNLEGWFKVMSDFAEVRFVLFLDCPEEVMEQRLLGRGRGDDNAETIKKRFHTYQVETRPIIDYFAQQGKVRQVDSSKPIDEVFKTITDIFTEFKPEASVQLADTTNRLASMFETPAQLGEDPKKAWSQGMKELIRQQNHVDEEAPKEVKAKVKQFWDFPVEKQKEFVVHVAKKQLFDPYRAEWRVEAASYFQLSGGYTVTATEPVTDEVHTAYINSYGVLENCQGPTLKPKTHLISAVETEDEGDSQSSCSIM